MTHATAPTSADRPQNERATSPCLGAIAEGMWHKASDTRGTVCSVWLASTARTSAVVSPSALRSKGDQRSVRRAPP